MKLDIYTDGSCYHVDGGGGWAYLVVQDDEEIYQDFGNLRNTTISVMEMSAVYNSLKYLKECYIKQGQPIEVNIHCDSAFVVNAFLEKWYVRWREVDWYGVKNIRLWQKILKLYFTKGMNVKFIKVKGHSGNKWNDAVDYYAGIARKELKEEIA